MRVIGFGKVSGQTLDQCRFHPLDRNRCLARYRMTLKEIHHRFQSTPAGLYRDRISRPRSSQTFAAVCPKCVQLRLVVAAFARMPKIFGSKL